MIYIEFVQRCSTNRHSRNFATWIQL